MQDQVIRFTHEQVYEVVWPLGKSVVASSVRLNPPIVDLNGKTIGQLWDHIFKGDEMFAIIRQRLTERFPQVKFVDYDVFGDTHGPNEAEVTASLPELLRQHGCDAIINGVGA